MLVYAGGRSSLGRARSSGKKNVGEGGVGGRVVDRCDGSASLLCSSRNSARVRRVEDGILDVSEVEISIIVVA